MRRYYPDVSPLFEADKITNPEIQESALRWMEASNTLKRVERRSRIRTFMVVAGQLALATTLTVFLPLHIWLILVLVATTTIVAHIQEERSKMRKLIEELKPETKLLYAAYLSVFRSIKTKGNSTVTAEECATLMTTATMS